MNSLANAVQCADVSMQIINIHAKSCMVMELSQLHDVLCRTCLLIYGGQ